MEIFQPRRILILSPPSATIAPIINTLVPPPDSTSSGTHSEDPEPIHHIKTPYYSAKVPIWTDIIEDGAAWSSEWQTQDGAADVVSAVGAWIVAFSKPATRAEFDDIKTILSSIASVISHHNSTLSPDTLQLAIALPYSLAGSIQISDAEWDDICREQGNWEYIDATASGAVNEYGEKTGLPRLLQSLQSGEWDAGETLDNPSDSELGDVFDEVDDDAGRAFDPAGAAKEAGSKVPILDSGGVAGLQGAGDGDEDEDENVEALQRMLMKMQAARDMGGDLPAAERKRMAREAVRGVMKEL